MQFHHKLQTQ
uniref:Uncharacterized protein n=1 Tax=Rhizophora mucronata TaxID=61149 RepID=A0A2P2IZ81_RHIMU